MTPEREPHAIERPPSGAETTGPRMTRAEARDAKTRLVPRWLAALVLVLLLAVVLVSGFVIRGLLSLDERVSSPQEIEIRAWSERVAANPTDPKAHLGLGYAYQSDGRYDKALDEYAIVLKAEPKNTAALYNRATIYFKLDAGDRAEKSMLEVLAVDPTHALAAKALGEHYARTRQYESLIAAVGPAAGAHPELADLQYLLGMAHEKLGENEAAAAYYRLAVKFAPDLAAAQEGLKRIGAGK